MWFFLVLALAGLFILIYSGLVDFQEKRYSIIAIKLLFAVLIGIMITQVLEIIVAINNISYYIPGIVD